MWRFVSAKARIFAFAVSRWEIFGLRASECVSSIAPMAAVMSSAPATSMVSQCSAKSVVAKAVIGSSEYGFFGSRPTASPARVVWAMAEMMITARPSPARIAATIRDFDWVA